MVGRVLEVAEGRDRAAAVGVHARPHAAAAIQTSPMPTQYRCLLEMIGSNPCPDSQRAATSPLGPATDHGDVCCHLRNCRTTSAHLGSDPVTRGLGSC